MTKREFYTNVINANISEEMTTQAETYIAKLDSVNENRRNSLNPNQKANEEIMDTIFNSMEIGVTYTAASIGELVGITTAKASSLCGKLADRERIVKGETKIKGKGKVCSYTRTE